MTKKPKQKDLRPKTMKAKQDRKAFLLLAVLLVLSAITLSAVAFSHSMYVGHEESVLAGEYIQARYAADSAIDHARLFLAGTRLERDEAGGSFNNPSNFQAIPVLAGKDPLNPCNYTLVAPDLDESGKYASIRYGLQNESARLNINVLPLIDQSFSVSGLMQQAGGAAMGGMISGGAVGGSTAGGSGASSIVTSSAAAQSAMSAGGSGAAGTGAAGIASGGVGRSLLMALPGMTEDVADAILDFVDSDDEPREYGAEREYYNQLSVPYSPVNGPLQSIEQLLLVRGVTPELLFGMDQNRNGYLDPSEMNASVNALPGATGSLASPDAQSQIPELGWSMFLTLYSKEKNVASDGTARININGQDLATLQTDLSSAVGDDLATFIIAYRVLGGNNQGGGQGGNGGGNNGGGNAGAGGGVPGGGMGGGPGGGQGGPGRGGNGPGGGRGDNAGGNRGPGGRDGGPGGNRDGGGNQGGRGDGNRGGNAGPGNGGRGGQGPGQGPGQGGNRGGFGGGPGGGFGGGQGGGGQGGDGGPRPGGNRGGGGGGRGRSNFDLSVLDINPFGLVSFLQQRGGGVRQNQGGPGGPGGGGGPGFGGGGGGGRGPGGAQGGFQGGRGPGGPGAGGPGAGGPGGGGRGRDQNGGGRDGGGRDGGRGGNDRGGRDGGRDQNGGGRDGGRGQGGRVGGVMGGFGSAGGGGGNQAGGAPGRTEQWQAAAFTALNIDTSSQSGSVNIRQVLDLIGAQFTANVNGEQITYTSPLENNPIAMAIYLPTIMDKLTAVQATVLPGRININEAPREILAGLPGMSQEILDALLEARSQAADNSNRKFETWPMVEGIISLQQMQMIAPLVTGGGDVMRAQSIGYFEKSAGFARVEAVIDAAGQVPTVVMYRKMDHLGRGFSQATLGLRAQGLVLNQ